VGWFQILVPAGTPAKVIETLNREINKITQSPEVTTRLADFGVYARQDSVEGAREFFSSQQKAMKKIVAELGIQAQ
jgi:tripartite-type tricarboxylate transporter receptor subunit TctC